MNPNSSNIQHYWGHIRTEICLQLVIKCKEYDLPLNGENLFQYEVSTVNHTFTTNSTQVFHFLIVANGNSI